MGKVEGILRIARPTVKEWICQSWPIKVNSDRIPNSLREIVKAAQKYNATISVMRAPMELRLEMPAFHHPFARNKNLQNNSKAMRCLQDNHGAKTVGDLVQIVAENGLNPTNPCLYENLNGRKCKEKAIDLLNRVEHLWKPSQESPQRHNLWHTPRTKKKESKGRPCQSASIIQPRHKIDTQPTGRH